MVQFLLVMLVLAAAVAIVAWPLWHGTRDEAEPPALAQLEAAKEAKYREIRDAELDYRTGKLSEPDWRAQDRALRAAAVELLRALDAAGGGDEPAS